MAAEAQVGLGRRQQGVVRGLVPLVAERALSHRDGSVDPIVGGCLEMIEVAIASFKAMQEKDEEYKVV